ncbi:unnamed protein product [Protopolystoma xenopodis]|uniref:Uncharacterized protein n=1 Tax=Protopolystoma xenopodis TaxID=117903 RepID=A0A448XHD8_9PLAT|nr:unnamed protein product [Protopolystoma xenopodis]
MLNSNQNPQAPTSDESGLHRSAGSTAGRNSAKETNIFSQSVFPGLENGSYILQSVRCLGASETPCASTLTANETPSTTSDLLPPGLLAAAARLPSLIGRDSFHSSSPFIQNQHNSPLGLTQGTGQIGSSAPISTVRMRVKKATSTAGSRETTFSVSSRVGKERGRGRTRVGTNGREGFILRDGIGVTASSATCMNSLKSCRQRSSDSADVITSLPAETSQPSEVPNDYNARLGLVKTEDQFEESPVSPNQVFVDQQALKQVHKRSLHQSSRQDSSTIDQPELTQRQQHELTLASLHSRSQHASPRPAVIRPSRHLSYFLAPQFSQAPFEACSDSRSSRSTQPADNLICKPEYPPVTSASATHTSNTGIPSSTVSVSNVKSNFSLELHSGVDSSNDQIKTSPSYHLNPACQSSRSYSTSLQTPQHLQHTQQQQLPIPHPSVVYPSQSLFPGSIVIPDAPDNRDLIRTRPPPPISTIASSGWPVSVLPSGPDTVTTTSALTEAVSAAAVAAVSAAAAAAGLLSQSQITSTSASSISSSMRTLSSTSSSINYLTGIKADLSAQAQLSTCIVDHRISDSALSGIMHAPVRLPNSSDQQTLIDVPFISFPDALQSGSQALYPHSSQQNHNDHHGQHNHHPQHQLQHHILSPLLSQHGPVGTESSTLILSERASAMNEQATSHQIYLSRVDLACPSPSSSPVSNTTITQSETTSNCSLPLPASVSPVSITSSIAQPSSSLTSVKVISQSGSHDIASFDGLPVTHPPLIEFTTHQQHRRSQQHNPTQHSAPRLHLNHSIQSQQVPSTLPTPSQQLQSASLLHLQSSSLIQQYSHAPSYLCSGALQSPASFSSHMLPHHSTHSVVGPLPQNTQTHLLSCQALSFATSSAQHHISSPITQLPPSPTLSMSPSPSTSPSVSPSPVASGPQVSKLASRSTPRPVSSDGVNSSTHGAPL